jgi:hypothetical protein
VLIWLLHLPWSQRSILKRFATAKEKFMNVAYREIQVPITARLATIIRHVAIKRSTFRLGFAVCSLTIPLAGIVFGQAITGTISGTVQELSGAAVAAAHITY